MKLIVIISAIALSSCMRDEEDIGDLISKLCKDAESVTFQYTQGPFSWDWDLSSTCTVPKGKGDQLE